MIGVGNSLRGDDGVGPVVADRLRNLPGIAVHAYEGEGLAPCEAASNYLPLRAASIYGGASEVQKNIIASTVLGL